MEHNKVLCSYMEIRHSVLGKIIGNVIYDLHLDEQPFILC